MTDDPRYVDLAALLETYGPAEPDPDSAFTTQPAATCRVVAPLGLRARAPSADLARTMSDMNRRNFLFGTVAAAASGTALVLTAPKEALSLFQPTLKETLALTRAPTPVRYDPLDIGETLYNAKGTPVALVTSLHIEADPDPVETTMFGDATRSLAFGGAFGGSLRVHIEAEGRFDTVTELHTSRRRHRGNF